MQKAIGVLENATDGKKVKDAALKASKLVLEYSARFITISDIMARLDAMEEQDKQRADAGDIYQ